MKFLLYSRGYVRIKVWGTGVERFLNLCSLKHLNLWDIQSQNKYIYLNIRLHDFYQCRKLAKKAGVRAVVVERHGLPFFIPKIRKRSFFIIGILLFVTLWIVSTNMLLKIKLYGNYSITEDVFMDFLEVQHIRIGMWKKDVDLETLEKKIRNEFDVITWTSGKINGTVLEIHMKENEKPETKDDGNKNKYGSSIYSNVDGIIQSIYVRNGVPVVRKGAEVKKGDLLVDGRVPIYNMEQLIAYYQYYEADADILIETEIPVLMTLDKVYVEKRYTGTTKEGLYLIFGKKIYRNKIFERKMSVFDLSLCPKQFIKIGDFEIGFGDFCAREYLEIEREYKNDEAKRLLLKEFDKNNALLEEKGVQILEKDVTIDLIMGKWTLSGKMRAVMPAYTVKPNEIPEELNDGEGI